MDNYKREIKYVNFMRDRQNANVYVLVTGKNTGGGDKFTLYFEGQEEFSGINDTLSINTENDDTDREISDAILSVFKKGILPYLLQTPLAKKITYQVILNDENKEEQPNDPWNSWVFSISAGGSAGGQSSSDRLNLRGRISANHITEKNKINFNYSYYYNRSNFYQFTKDSLGTIIDTTTYTSFKESQYLYESNIFGLNDHWSVGSFFNFNTSSYSNVDYGISLKAGIEYDIFPYQETDRRKLAFIYRIGGIYNDYVDTTIYLKTKELLWQHNLEINFVQKQKWGSIFFGAEYSNYLHDFKLNRLSFRTDIDWNIAKGLTFGLGGSFALISDQITLPKSAVDTPALLLQTRIIETSFIYWTFFNVRYTFGSKYANVVNPRFESGGGGYYFF